MVSITAKAHNNLLCSATHGPSGVVLKTDAPADIGGDASSFSPTDLMATALLTCIMTTMGVVANKIGLDLSGMDGHVEKEMRTESPRRMHKVTVRIHVPLSVDDDIRARLERAAQQCPVSLSLHPDVEKDVQISWK